MSLGRKESGHIPQNGPQLSTSYSQAYTPHRHDAFEQAYRFVRNLFAIVWSAVLYATIGDLYKLLSERLDFITGELYDRSKATGVGIAYAGPQWLPWTPQVIVVSGSASNASKVADYGEGNNPDPDARKPVGNVIHHILGGKQSLFTMHGPEASTQRALMKRHLGTDNMNDTYQFCHDFFDRWIREWDPSICYQNYVVYMASNVVAQRVWGIGYIDKSFAPILRKLGDFISTANVESAEFKALCRELNAIGERLLNTRTQEVIQARKYAFDILPDDAKENAATTDFEKLQAVVTDTHATSGLVVADNFSKLTMSALAYINNDESIVKQLLEELASNPDWQTNWRALNSLPYLECVYKEILRIMSPTSLVPRQTSHSFSLTVKGKDDRERTYSIPAGSRMFVPLRRINNDPDAWPNPHVFNPSRFLTGEGQANKSNFVAPNFIPFSTGMRPCPAGSYFVPVTIKAMITLFFSNYRLKLDKPLEDIPVNAVTSKWQQDYYATLVPACSANLEMVQRETLEDPAPQSPVPSR